MRNLASALATGICLVAMASPAQAQTQDFRIQAGSLKSALDSFAKQSRRQVIYRADEVRGARSPGANGKMNAEVALDRLLTGTGFTVRVDRSGALAIVKLKVVSQSIASSSRGANLSAEEAGSSSADGAVPNGGEIVVTALKREQRLSDVPVPIAVVRADELIATGKTRIQDYFSRVPGLNVTDMVGGTPALVIRGIATGGYGNPTVGTTIDDVPVGFSTATGGGYQAVELDPSDLESLEVLRGPQGTLYGASSLGGLVRYITRTPSLSDLNVRFGASIFGVDGGDLGGSIRGGVNLPLADDLAISASGFWRKDAGYIDDQLRGLSDINYGDAYGGRFALNWQPADNLAIKANLIHQKSFKNASDDVSGPDLQALEAASSFIPGSSGYRSRMTFADIVIDLDLGDVNLTSVTGYSDSRNRFYFNFDQLAALVDSIFNVTGVPYTYDSRGDKFSQEIRANVAVRDNIDGLFGLFYTKENSETDEILQAGDFTTGNAVAILSSSNYPTSYEEYAFFGDLTLKLSPSFEIQFGARKSFIEQTFSSTSVGPLAGIPSSFTVTKDEAFTYLVTPTFRITPDIMVYARAASGYRPGGPNTNAELGGLPDTYGPDTTRNYDIGLKGQTPDRVLAFDASLYYIDWKNVQLRVVFPGGASVTNAGGARSKGAELSLTLAPIPGLEISGWVAYNDAKLTQALPPLSPAQAIRGDRLPYSSKFSGSLSIDKRFRLSESIDGYVGGSADFIGDRFSDFTPTGVARTELPAYTKFDLRAGADLGVLSIDFFVNNVTNKRGIISSASTSPAFHIIAPRTIGMSLATKF